MPLPFRINPHFNHSTALHSYCPDCYSNNFEFVFERYVDVKCECGWTGDKYDMLICTEYEYKQKYLKKYLRRKKLERILNK